MAEATERVEMAREIKEQTARIDVYVQAVRYILKNRERLNQEFAGKTDDLLGHLVDHFINEADRTLTGVQVRVQEMLNDPRKEA